ncbi:hypothetical protein COY88_03090 [Candidatus Roizmanbacteria bacterium CG_4_10_14_0_8_um_filter_35_28]|uniref:Uncharacterized protein n=3 Tax=Candidatus Roizmaniibacteriota TaxID=1752723 RepID=A0A2G9Y6K1_9BACT|nr:MAG: hypothetical protein COX47_03020 [Candidatus Roizmanbacteria bacterium CG23_combo_of_CG06-09_8_20_14_all_35_49]PIY70914.1 MAG: hypothetical protein COY88_03090 [Candidatus Roizmanbacteria bacterium CG_4_10_14_0_8_um_filter_35_28]
MTEQEKQEAYKHKLELFQAMVQVDSKEKEIKSSHGYGKAYLWSILIPPIGIYYFLKHVFFSGGEEKSIKTGIISLVLTLVSFFLSFWLVNNLFKQTTSGIPRQNLQILKDLAVPDNQKTLLQLFK